MKIDILCPGGSPLGVTPQDIYTRGVGGAELALLTFFEVMTARGHNVTVYNDPNVVCEGFEPLYKWNHADQRDAVIMFREPHHTFHAAVGKKVFWSCDQYTRGSYSKDIFPYADAVVCISPRHSEYFAQTYRYNKAVVMDLGVRMEDYTAQVTRKPGQVLFCSVPDRGLGGVHAIWPYITQAVPNSQLIITSDYSLWGMADPGTSHWRKLFAGMSNVSFLGKVPREQLCRLQLESDIHLYPCVYDELFCISAAECQVAGAYPITSSTGALVTTNRFGCRVLGNPSSIDFLESMRNTAIALMTKSRNDLENMRTLMMEAARQAFDWNVIAEQWEGVLA